MSVTEFKLRQIVKSNYCRYDLDSGCVQGEADRRKMSFATERY